MKAHQWQTPFKNWAVQEKKPKNGEDKFL